MPKGVPFPRAREEPRPAPLEGEAAVEAYRETCTLLARTAASSAASLAVLVARLDPIGESARRAADEAGVAAAEARLARDARSVSAVSKHLRAAQGAMETVRRRAEALAKRASRSLDQKG